MNKIKIISWIWVCLMSFSMSYAQDLFDYTHVSRYADYLYNTGEFETSAKEYERLVFMNDSVSFKQRLVASYRKSGDYQKAFKRINSFEDSNGKLPAYILGEYTKLLVVSNQFDRADSILILDNQLTDNQRRIGLFHTQLLRKNWKQAQVQFEEIDSVSIPKYSDYRSLLQQAHQQSRKSPVLAGFMSGIVPGLGKVYTKDWKDGLTGFLFVGAVAFQSYRGFSKKGIDSVSGWAYGGVALGFYIGNIWGSAKAARNFNRTKNEHIFRQAKMLCYTDY
jgi:tetratricopeptide (TPR) repeat protein